MPLSPDVNSVRRSFWTYVAVLTTVLAAQMLHPMIPILTYVILTLWALRSVSHAVQAIVVAWIILLSNPALFQTTSTALALRWFVLFAATSRLLATRLFSFRHHAIPAYAPWLLAFIALITAHALLNQPPLVVSTLKAATLLAGIIVALEGFAERPAAYWLRWFSAVALVLVLFSAPLLVSDTGYIVNGRGFQGLLNQPQAFGLVMALILSVSVSSIVFGKTTSLSTLLLAGASGVLLVASEARTAVLALLFALPTTLLLAARHIPSWRTTMVVTAFMTIGLLLLFYPALADATRSFLLKWHSADVAQISVAEALVSSRADKIALSWENFLRSPLLGIGLGVPSQPSAQGTQTSLLGLTSAAVEKGFLPTAVLEETGLLGTVLFLCFLATALSCVFKARHPIAIFLCTTALALNCGEAVLLSVGGMGMFVWLALGYSRYLALASRPAPVSARKHSPPKGQQPVKRQSAVKSRAD